MAAKFNRRGIARLKATLQSHIDRGRIPGAIAVAARAGQVEVFECLGRLDPAQDRAMPEDAIFRIYSMTKPVVSVAAMILAEEGQLQLNDPVAKFFPEFAGLQVAGESGTVPAARQPTVHDLLRHTSGLTYGFLGDNPVQRLYRDRRLLRREASNREFCRELASLPLQEQPGTWFQYSVSTDVLGAIVEQVSGRALGQFLAERIFTPLGMADTAFSAPRDAWPRIAEPFAVDPETGLAPDMLDPREVPVFESGGGGLVGTAADYIRFLRMLHGRGSVGGTRVLSRKTVDWMTSDHLGATPARNDLLLPGYGFGLGFAVRTHAGMAPQPGSVGQYFWSGIGGTSFFVDPQEDIFAMLLTQAPHQRIFFRNLFRHLVYAALD